MWVFKFKSYQFIYDMSDVLITIYNVLLFEKIQQNTYSFQTTTKILNFYSNCLYY